MRKLLIVGLVLFVALAAAFALAFRNLDTYLAENRDLVAAQVAEVLGREVHFESVAVSWTGGFGVRVIGLRVGDDPNYSDEDFLSAEVVDVRVKVLPALSGRVEVGRVVLRSPRVFVTQTRGGLSTDSLGGGAAAPAAGTAEGGGPAAPIPPEALGIALLDMRDAALRFVDRSVKPALTLEVTQLDMRATELGLVDPVAFEMSAAIFGAAKQNLSVTGTVGPLVSQTPRLDIELQIDPLSLDEALKVSLVRALLPQDLTGSGVARIGAEIAGTLGESTFSVELDASGAALRLGDAFDKPSGTRLDIAVEGTLQGDRIEMPSVKVRLGDTSVAGSAQAVLAEPMRVSFDLGSDRIEPAAFGAGEAGDVVRDLSLKGDVSLPASGPRGSVALRSPAGQVRGADYTSLAADVKLRGGRTEIDKLTVNAFDGVVNARGYYETAGGSAPSFVFDVQLSGMLIESVVQMVSGSGAELLNGTMDAKVAVNGSGSDVDEILQRLRGKGELRLTNGVLKDFNPAGETLRALMLIPALGGGGIARVLDRHPGVLGEGDTPIDDLVTHFNIAGGWLDVDDLMVRTPEYVLTGEGRYAFAGELDFKTALSFSEELSQELLAEERDLRYIRDTSGRITLPVALKGAPPDINVLPDVTKIAGNVAREVLVDVISDAIGGKRAEPAGGAGGNDAGGLIGGILGGALGQKPPPEADAPAAQPSVEELGGELLRKGLGGLLGGSRD